MGRRRIVAISRFLIVALGLSSVVSLGGSARAGADAGMPFAQLVWSSIIRGHGVINEEHLLSDRVGDIAVSVPWATSLRVFMGLGNIGGDGEAPVEYRWSFTCYKPKPGGGVTYNQTYTPIEQTMVPGHDGDAFIATRWVYGQVQIPPNCINYPRGNPLNPKVMAHMRRIVNGSPTAWVAGSTYMWTMEPAQLPGAPVPSDNGDGITLYRWVKESELEYGPGGVRLRPLQGRYAEFVLTACDVAGDIKDLYDGSYKLVKGIVRGEFDPYYSVRMHGSRDGIMYVPIEVINSLMDIHVYGWPFPGCPV